MRRLSPIARLGVLPVGAAVALSACASKSEGADQRPEGPPPAPVVLAEVRTGSLQTEWSLLGEVRSEAHARLAAGEPGQVRRVTVREGDRVEQGALLVEIDPSLARAQMSARAARTRQTRAQKEQAVRDAERMAGAGQKAVAAREIEEAQSRRTQLEAQEAAVRAEVQEARARLSRHRVVAPFAGQVLDRSVDTGDWVNPGDAVIELVATERLEILVDAPPRIVRHVQEGTGATLRQGEQRLDATVEGLVRALDRDTRTAKVRLRPTETPPWLLAGSTVTAVFRVEEREDGAVIAPRDALVTGAVGRRIVKATDEGAQPVDVTLLASTADEVLVRGEGLAAGDRVVVRGNERLRPGQPLEVVDDGS